MYSKKHSLFHPLSLTSTLLLLGTTLFTVSSLPGVTAIGNDVDPRNADDFLDPSRGDRSILKVRGSTNPACAELSSNVGSKTVHFAGDPTFVYESTHYYDARSGLNKPGCVFLPTTALEVSSAIKIIKSHNSTFAIKSGGHTGNGDAQWSSTDGGVLLDLKDLNEVVYNETTGTAFVGGGNRFVNIYKSLPEDVTIVGGRLSDVGVGGWTVGGGLSYLSAKWGLGVDNYASLEVVLPNGDIVNATADNDYGDLFFALKGGGNQFGIVTTFEFHAHQIPKFSSGDLTYGVDQVPAVLNATQKYASTYADDNSAIIVTLTKTTLDLPVLIVFLVYMGETVPDGVFDDFLAIPHLTDTRSVKTYTETCTMNDFGSIYGPKQAFWTVPISIDRLAEAHAKFDDWALKHALDYDLASLDLQPVPKSLIRAGVEAGGNPIFSGSEDSYIWLNLLLAWTVADDDRFMEAAYNFTLEVGAEPGYPLFLNDGDWKQDVVQSYAHYDKLVPIKHKYDPDGFFTTNTGGPRYT